MAYIIDGYTLPRPHSFDRVQIEVGQSNQMLDGTTKKDLMLRKERYVLSFTKLTQAEVNAIIAKWNLETTLDFSVTESNLTIASTECHMNVSSRQYNTGGDEYREDLTITLMEVS